MSAEGTDSPAGRAVRVWVKGMRERHAPGEPGETEASLVVEMEDARLPFATLTTTSPDLRELLRMADAQERALVIGLAPTKESERRRLQRERLDALRDKNARDAAALPVSSVARAEERMAATSLGGAVRAMHALAEVVAELVREIRAERSERRKPGKR